MPSMSSSEYFYSHIVPLSPQIWRMSARFRGRLSHGTHACPQRVSPLVAAPHVTLCAPCSEYHHTHLLEVDRRVAPKLRAVEDPTVEHALTLAMRSAPSDRLAARDKYDASRGLACKLSALATRAQWFVRAVPDPVDQELVIQVLYFVRGGDRFERGGLPVGRYARRYGLDVEVMRVRLASALGSIRAEKPDWVEANFDRPLSERLAELAELTEDVAA